MFLVILVVALENMVMVGIGLLAVEPRLTKNISIIIVYFLLAAWRVRMNKAVFIPCL